MMAAYAAAHNGIDGTRSALEGKVNNDCTGPVGEKVRECDSDMFGSRRGDSHF